MFAATQGVLPNGQLNNKRGTLVGLTFGRNKTSMPVDNFSTDRQPDAGSFVDTSRVEPLKDVEYSIEVSFVESDAVIFDPDLADVDFRVGAVQFRLPGMNVPTADLDMGRLVGQVKFERVSNEVLQELTHLERIGLNGGQTADLDASTGLIDFDFEIGHHLAGNGR